MIKIIRQECLTEEDVDRALSLLKKKIMEKIGSKPKYPFVSQKEAVGKLTEEIHEIVVSLHEEDWEEFDSEMLDCAYVCMRYIAGKGKTSKSEQDRAFWQ